MIYLGIVLIVPDSTCCYLTLPAMTYVQDVPGDSADST